MSFENIKQLRALAVFAVVVENSSFSEAARKLQTSRSRVSETVAKLEAELGIRLLNRSTRNLTLTSEGKSVYQHAAQLQQILDDVEIDTNQNIMRGRISLTCNHDVGAKLLAPHFAEFQQCYPDIDLELVLDDEPLDLIAEEIDLAVRVGVPKDSSLVGRALFEDTLKIFASPDYLKRYGIPNTVEELDEHRWIQLPQLFGRKSVELRNKEKRYRVTPKRLHLCSAPLMVKEMLRCGMGLAVLLPSTTQDVINTGDIVPVLPQWTGGTLTFSIMYPSRKHLPHRTRYLIDFLVKRLQR